MTVIDLRDRSGRGRAAHVVRVPRPRSAPRRPAAESILPPSPMDAGWRVVGLDAAAAAVGGVIALAALPGISPAMVAAVLLGWPLALCSSGAYSSRLHDRANRRLSSVAGAAVRLLAALAVAALVVPGLEIGPVVASALVVSGSTGAARWAADRRWSTVRASVGPPRAIVRGSCGDVEALLRHVRGTPGAPFAIVGVQYTDDPGPSAELLEGLVVLPGASDLVDAAIRLEADAVVLVGSQPDPSVALRQLVWALEETGITAHMVPVVAPLATPNVTSMGDTGLPLLSFHTRDLGSEVGFSKVVVDKLLALAGVVALAPLMIATALVVAATSRGPVLFRQVRVGRDGREFRMLKFRTMYRDAEAVRAELATLNVHSGGTLFKIKDDPRITPVGRFLRKYSLDELPQLFNVVRGEMSLVGPRPPLPEEVVNYAPEAHRRFRVRPGLTGLWQVSGRSDLDPVESTRLDTHYVEHWSVGMDLQILARTPRVVVSGEGAY